MDGRRADKTKTPAERHMPGGKAGNDRTRQTNRRNARMPTDSIGPSVLRTPNRMKCHEAMCAQRRLLLFFNILGRPTSPLLRSVCVMTVTSRRGIWNNFWFRQQQQQQQQQQQRNKKISRNPAARDSAAARAAALHKYDDADLLQ